MVRHQGHCLPPDCSWPDCSRIGHSISHRQHMEIPPANSPPGEQNAAAIYTLTELYASPRSVHSRCERKTKDNKKPKTSKITEEHKIRCSHLFISSLTVSMEGTVACECPEFAY